MPKSPFQFLSRNNESNGTQIPISSSQVERKSSLSISSKRLSLFTKKRDEDVNLAGTRNSVVSPTLPETSTQDLASVAIRSKRSIDGASVQTRIPRAADPAKKKRPLSIASSILNEQEHPRSRQRTSPPPFHCPLDQVSEPQRASNVVAVRPSNGDGNDKDKDGSSREPERLRQRTISTRTVTQRTIKDKASVETLRAFPSGSRSPPLPVHEEMIKTCKDIKNLMDEVTNLLTPALRSSSSVETLRAPSTKIPRSRPPLLAAPTSGAPAPPLLSTHVKPHARSAGPRAKAPAHHTRPLSMNDVDEVIRAEQLHSCMPSSCDCADARPAAPQIDHSACVRDACVLDADDAAGTRYPKVSLKYHKKHVELWDPEPEAHYVFPAQLHLAFPPHVYDPFDPPKVGRIDLYCCSLSRSSSSASPPCSPVSKDESDEPEYETFFAGHTTAPSHTGSSSGGAAPKGKSGPPSFFLDPGNGIHVEGRWRRSRPGLRTSASAGVSKKASGRKRHSADGLEDNDPAAGAASLTDTEDHASETGTTTTTTTTATDGTGKEDEDDPPANANAIPGLWSWYVKFFVPIPMHMFLGREDVVFRVRAKVVVGRAESEGEGGVEEEVCVDKEMSVSCLRWERMIVAAPR